MPGLRSTAHFGVIAPLLPPWLDGELMETWESIVRTGIDGEKFRLYKQVGRIIYRILIHNQDLHMYCINTL